MQYNVIYADPPWFYNARENSYAAFLADRTTKTGAGRTKFGGGAGKQYPLLKTGEIIAMRPRIDAWAAKNCALFLWATCPKLDQAFAVLKGWGFRYATVAFAWEKVNRVDGQPVAHPGYYTASNVELVLLGVRGSMRPVQPMIRQVIREPRRGHSRKPDEVAARIERMYPQAARLELFARQSRPGWTTMGNAIDGRDIRDALAV